MALVCAADNHQHFVGDVSSHLIRKLMFIAKRKSAAIYLLRNEMLLGEVKLFAMRLLMMYASFS